MQHFLIIYPEDDPPPNPLKRTNNFITSSESGTHRHQTLGFISCKRLCFIYLQFLLGFVMSVPAVLTSASKMHAHLDSGQVTDLAVAKRKRKRKKKSFRLISKYVLVHRPSALLGAVNDLKYLVESEQIV